MNRINFPQRLDESSASFFQGLRSQPCATQQDRVLDLSPVRYFDFSGAELFLDYLATQIPAEGRLSVYVPQPQLLALLRFMQFDNLVPLTPSTTKEYHADD